MTARRAKRSEIGDYITMNSTDGGQPALMRRSLDTLKPFMTSLHPDRTQLIMDSYSDRFCARFEVVTKAKLASPHQANQ